MNIRFLLAAATMTVAAAAASPAARADIVTNGDFATGDLTGWTQGGDTSYVSAGRATVSPGELNAPTGNAAYLGTSLAQGDISQTITTVAGQSYFLSFFLQADSGSAAPDFFTTFVDGVKMDLLSIADVGQSDWAFYSAKFVGTGSDTLDFAFRNDPSWFELTDVSVSVPEPSSLAIMLVGIAGLGYGARRRGMTAVHS